MTYNIRLSEIIPSKLYSVHNDILNDNYTHYFIKGGRGSGKSSFISIEIIISMMRTNGVNAIVFRKVGNNLRESVFEQIKWAIDILGVGDLWEIRLTPLSITYKKTGQTIFFKGADDVRKIKSTKVSQGYFKFIWYEELDEFLGMEEIRSINQSIMRGGEKFCVFYSFNPPKNNMSWVNNIQDISRKNTTFVHTTYLDMKKKWLGNVFIEEANYLKSTNYELYKNEYLGHVTGVSGQVFKNITIREIDDSEIEGFCTILRGIDWGYASDPFVYIVLAYDNKKRICYIFYEFYKVGAKFNEIANVIKLENKLNKQVIADSAEPRSNDELRDYGIYISPCKKGNRSVEFGIKFLQDLNEIVIDQKRCKNTANEFLQYSIDENKQQNNSYPDMNNHTIDAVRYALNNYIRRKSISFK